MYINYKWLSNIFPHYTCFSFHKPEVANVVEEVFVGAYPNCEPCPECYQNWRNTLLQLGDNFAAQEQSLMSKYKSIEFGLLHLKFAHPQWKIWKSKQQGECKVVKRHLPPVRFCDKVYHSKYFI